MKKCSKRFKVVLKFFKVRDKHQFIITNAFYTLEYKDQLDVIKTCDACGAKEAFLTDSTTLSELVLQFPNAFNPILKEFIESWTK
jgi:ATP adenylyltransferase/5',5'''-P-1,P-4-tetraphosphate phosphorylase II